MLALASPGVCLSDFSQPMTRRRWIADEVSGNRAALMGTMPSIWRACFVPAMARNLISQLASVFIAAASPLLRKAESNSSWEKKSP